MAIPRGTGPVCRTEFAALDKGATYWHGTEEPNAIPGGAGSGPRSQAEVKSATTLESVLPAATLTDLVLAAQWKALVRTDGVAMVAAY